MIAIVPAAGKLRPCRTDGNLAEIRRSRMLMTDHCESLSQVVLLAESAEFATPR